MKQLLRFAWVEAQCCLFAVLFFLGLALVRLVPLPIDPADALLLWCLGVTLVLWLVRWETGREVAVIFGFHLVGLALELFKVAQGSWSYPDTGLATIGGVPLYSGFMYAAVGSYVCQAWRRLDLRITGYRARATACVAVLIYLNFFTSHVTWDVRVVLALALLLVTRRTWVHFTVGRHRYAMPLALSFVLIGFFLWARGERRHVAAGLAVPVAGVGVDARPRRQARVVVAARRGQHRPGRGGQGVRGTAVRDAPATGPSSRAYEAPPELLAPAAATRSRPARPRDVGTPPCWPVPGWGRDCGTDGPVCTSRSRRGPPATHTNLSAVRSDGAVLWVAGDETATSSDWSPTTRGEPRRYARADELPARRLRGPARPPTGRRARRPTSRAWRGTGLPVGGRVAQPAPQADQGPARRGQGAPPAGRRSPASANRQILVRLPVADVDGAAHRRAASSSWTASAIGPPRSARTAPTCGTLLADDEHLGPFLPMPGKDNGLDVEGIAVAGPRVYLGLRGPVLRGWAMVLELRPEVDPDDPDRLRLTRLRRRPPLPQARPAPAAGSGVRDLCPHGDDLLVLAGPTMDLDGPVHVFRWHGALRVEHAAGGARATCSRASSTCRTARATTTRRASGCSARPTARGCWSSTTARRPARLTDDGAVLADVVRLP